MAADLPVAPKADAKQIIALDIGGTKIEAGIVDDRGEILTRRRIETPIAAAGDPLFACIGALLDQVLVDAAAAGLGPFAGIGVGCGGPMRFGGVTVSPLNIVGWRDFPLRARLNGYVAGHRDRFRAAEDLGDADDPDPHVFIDNDAKALAIAEGWIGAAQGRDNFIAMVVSTGVGGGIVLEGRLLDGADGNAGHIGHMIVEPNGTELPGHVPGTLEAEASGTAIAFRTGRPAIHAPLAEIHRAGTLVGRAVGSVANLLDLDLAVVAGSVALGFGTPFFAAAQQEIDRVAQLDHSRSTKIARGGLGPDGPLVGAGAVGWTGLGLRLLGG